MAYTAKGVQMGTTTFQGPVKTGPVISGSNYGCYRGKDLKDTQWVKNTVSMYFNEMAPGDDNGICTAQTPAAAGALTIDGALAETVNGVSVYAPSQSSVAATRNQAWARQIAVKSSGNDSGVNFTITGTDVNGKALSETITGPNAGTVYTAATLVGLFRSVTKVEISGAGTGNIEVGTGAATGGVLYARPIGVIPYQSSIVDMKLHMVEAFNSGTSDVVEIGKSDDPDYLADIPNAVMQTTTNVASGEVITTDATQIGDWRSVSQSETGADGVAYNSDVQVIVQLTSTGTLATTGIGYFSIDYMQGRDMTAADAW